MHNISDQTKMADAVLMKLDAPTFEMISPWLKTHPGPVAYTALKQQLTTLFDVPVTIRAQRALDLMLTPLGDTRPVEAWRELQKLVTLDEVNSDGTQREISLTKEIFLRRLPKHVRAQIENAENMKMDDLVQKADNLYLADRASRYAATHSVNEVQESEDTEHHEEQETEVNAIHQNRRPEPRFQPHRQRFPRPQPSFRRFQQPQQHHRPPHPVSNNYNSSSNYNPAWCRYHNSFGSRARNCVHPCSFSKN